MYPHRIRLRGPWEYETQRGSGRLTLPVALANTPLADEAGEILLKRHFGYPGRIDATERVWLRIAQPGAAVTLNLNGVAVGACDADAEWDVTDRLSARNELRITTTITAGEPWREVALEVRRTAYLRAVQINVEGDQVEASGEVIGHGEGRFDLYVLAGRRTVAYTSISLSAGVTPFRLAGAMEEPATTFRVDLVQGSVVWYRAEVEQGA